MLASSHRAHILCVLSLLLGGAPVRALEQDALAIDENIRARHMPYGTILDPVYGSPDTDQIVSYTRAGDEGVMALVASARLSALAWIELREVNLRKATRAALRERFGRRPVEGARGQRWRY